MAGGASEDSFPESACHSVTLTTVNAGWKVLGVGHERRVVAFPVDGAQGAADLFGFFRVPWLLLMLRQHRGPYRALGNLGRGKGRRWEQ
ncbi:MAG: hypothetical protein ACLRWP_07980 [Bilophila wadsworthia]